MLCLVSSFEILVPGAHRVGDHGEGREVQVGRGIPAASGGQERERRRQPAVSILVAVRRQLLVVDGRAPGHVHRKFLRLTRVLGTRGGRRARPLLRRLGDEERDRDTDSNSNTALAIRHFGISSYY